MGKCPRDVFKLGAIYAYALSFMLGYSVSHDFTPDSTPDSTIKDILPTTFTIPMFWPPEDLEELIGTATYGITGPVFLQS